MILNSKIDEAEQTGGASWEKHQQQKFPTNNLRKSFHSEMFRQHFRKLTALRHFATAAPVKLIPSTNKPKSSGNFIEGIREHQQRHEKHLLMARVGDFYEFYFEQAHVVSKVLGMKIARSKDQIFCGFPVYKLNDYVKVLLDEGFSVAKYEQFENVQANGQKVMVRRVDRIYTPGKRRGLRLL